LRKCVGRGEEISFSPASILRLSASLRSRSSPAISLPQGRGCLDLLGFRLDQRCGWRLGFFTASTISRAILVFNSGFSITCFRWAHNWPLRRRRHYLMYRGTLCVLVAKIKTSVPKVVLASAGVATAPEANFFLNLRTKQIAKICKGLFKCSSAANFGKTALKIPRRVMALPSAGAEIESSGVHRSF
jgi:hypothetical protein